MKFLKSLCITLAFVLLAGSVGFGTYKLLNRKPGGGVVSADNAAKIYEVDVNAFDYDLKDVPDGMVNGILVSGDLDVEDLKTNHNSVVSLFTKMFKDKFVYNPGGESPAEVYSGGVFAYYIGYSEGNGYGYVQYINSTSASQKTCYFCINYCFVENQLVIGFSKEPMYSSGLGTIDTPRNDNSNFSFEFNDGYVGKNVLASYKPYWMKADFIKTDMVKSEMTAEERLEVVNSAFKSIRHIGLGVTVTNCTGYTLASGTSTTGYNGWYVYEQPSNLNTYPLRSVRLLVRFVDGGFYVFMHRYTYLSVTSSSTQFSDGFLVKGSEYFGDKNLAMARVDECEFELNDGFELAKTEAVPYMNNKYFFNGVQVNDTHTNMSFSNLNQAREMLGIKEEDGAFSMTRRVDHEDYIKYVFNLKTDNMSLDFNVKVYKNNVCVLDYNKYYYVDNNGQVQTFSVTDITKPDSPFVYYYETQTHYYYLRRVDVLTSYQLKISKEILTIELNKSEQSA